MKTLIWQPPDWRILKILTNIGKNVKEWELSHLAGESPKW